LHYRALTGLFLTVCDLRQFTRQERGRAGSNLLVEGQVGHPNGGQKRRPWPVAYRFDVGTDLNGA
jgi:hypothetical protein